MNHVEIIEGFEPAIAALVVEKMPICGFYARIYLGVSLQKADSSRLQNMLEAALSELYATI